MATIGSLVLQLTARTDRLESQLKQAQGYIRQLQRQIESTRGTVASTERSFTQGFSRMAQAIDSTSQASARAGVLLRQFATVAATAFAGQLIRQSLQLGDSISDVAQQVGISVESLQKLRIAAIQNGGSAQVLDRALGNLNDKLGEARRGSTEAAQAFADIGIRWQDLQGLSVEEVLFRVIDALQQFPEAADRAARQSALLGERSRTLANLVALGSQRLREMGEQAERTGRVLSADMVRQLATANDTLEDMATLINAKVAIAVANLVPYIEDAADSVERIIGALAGTNQELAALSGFESSVVTVVNAIAAAFQALLPWLSQTATDLKNINALMKGTPTRMDLTGRIREIEQTLEVQTRMPTGGDPAKIQQMREELRKLQQQRVEFDVPGFGREMEAPAGPVKMEAVVVKGTRPPPPFDVKAGADAAKRLADLDKSLMESRRELEGWAAVMASLGQPIDQTTARIGFLETAIRARLKEGIPPTSAAIRALTAELAGLQQQAGDFTLAESRRELEGWAAVMASLGQPIDQTEARITALETVIRAKLKVAIPPTAAVMQTLTAELARLKQQADATFAATTIQDLRKQFGATDLEKLAPVFDAMNKQLFDLDNSIAAFGASSDDTASRVTILRQALEAARALGFTPLDPVVQGLVQQIKDLDMALEAIAATQAVDALRAKLEGLGKSLEEQFRTPLEQLRATRAELSAILATTPEYSASVVRAQRAANIEYAKTTVIGQGLTIVAQGITEAFQQSFEGIVQGTLTVSEAFRNMAQSILASISKILVQKGIEALLGLALAGLAPGAGAGVAAGGGGAFGGGGGFGGGGVGAAGGGAFQHGGRVPGTGRGDKVPLLAEPGEFILQRRAVEVLGQPFLRQLNEAPQAQLRRLQRTEEPRLQRQRRQRLDMEAPLQDLLRSLPRFQRGGPVGSMMGEAGAPLLRSPHLPMPPGVMSTQRTREAPVNITHTAIVVKNEQEAQAKRQELEAFENQIVTVVTKNILGGDGTMLNRSLRMVHGGR